MKLSAFNLLFIVFTFGIISCSETSITTTDEISEPVINSAKLIGTPFEGLTKGDAFNRNEFLCNEFQTNTVDSLPIPIFLAFFTEEEEGIIKEGIDIANTAAGTELYSVTDVWTNDVRVIYKVDDPNTVEGSIGFTQPREFFFNEQPLTDCIESDWVIVLKKNRVNKWTTAHELGHAMCIKSHALIDYENNTLLELEEGSIMESSRTRTPPLLNDYSYMMTKQTQILQSHFGELGHYFGEDCETLLD